MEVIKLIKKIIYLLIFLFVLCLMVLSYFHFFKEDVVPVLTYHNVVDVIEDDPNVTVNISTKKFEKQIKWLHDHGYKTITMDELYDWKVNNKKIPRKSILITFDDGWKSYYTKAIPILEKYNMKSNVFVVFKFTENVTKENSDLYMNFDDIKDIINNHKDMTILSHSYDLHNKENADSNDYDLYNNDMKKVEELGYNIKYYAYPYGHNNDNYIKALKDNNYRLAFTFGPYANVRKNDDNYKLPRIGMFESTKDWKFKLKLFLEM